MSYCKRSGMTALWLLVPVLAWGQDGSVAEFPTYKAVAGVGGSLKSVGSDTMNNLMTYWMEGFNKFYPNVVTQVEGKGSSTAPTALISGTANFGPMSRPMKAEEIDNFRKKFGFEPTGLRVGIDMIVFYVHRDNPIKSLSLAQLDAIFSKTRKAGGAKDVRTWGDLGLQGEWANKPVSAYGRNSASGTYNYVKEKVLAGGDFKDSIKEQPGSSSVVQAVATDKFGIGYSGIGFKTADVKAVPLSTEESPEPVSADAANAFNGTYPITRLLLVYMNYKPGAKLDPLRREFVRYMLSQQGQQAVIKDGYLPLPIALAKEVLIEVGIEAP
jgi:phosphate transport system substrate-binding protein